MRLLIPLAFAAMVSACSVAPHTASQASYDVTASFATALKGANTYAAMPRCSATVHPPCSDQRTVDQIIAAADKADIAVKSTQQIAHDTTASATDEQKAVAAANDAIAALNRIVPHA